MSIFKFNHLVSIFLVVLINFNFHNHLAAVAQSPILPYPVPNDDALLPFGSQATVGRFSSRCTRRFNSAGVFRMLNNCPYTVWAAAVPGGGRQLEGGQVWVVNPTPNSNGRFWGRTNCSFNSSGSGGCETGDCNGRLECQSYGGQPPVTLAEFKLGTGSFDFFDISLVDGFNIPMEFGPTSNGCNRGISCAANVSGECPTELRAAGGGCNSPCTVFKTPEYCCTGSHNSPTTCGPTNYSKFFKERCPDVYTYPYDDNTATFTCPGGTNYDIVFCP